jgi:hypothetical protein
MLWLVLIAVLALLAVAAYLIFNRSPSRASATEHGQQHAAGPQSPPIAPSSRYWGKRFEIPIPDNACAAAKALDGQAFALGQAPALPLSGCDHVGCQCHLVPLLDRRSSEERRAGHERRVDIRFDDSKVERRVHARRKDDDNYNWHYTA